jgi:hypothetical protein
VWARRSAASFTAALGMLLAAYPAAPAVAVICASTASTTPQRQTVDGRPPATASDPRRRLQPTRQPRRTNLGHPQDQPGQHRLHLDRTHPPGPRVLPAPNPGPDPDHRSTAHLILATQGLRAELSRIGLVFTECSLAGQAGRFGEVPRLER